MDKIFIIKVGGNIIDDEKKLSSFLQAFASIKEKKILVHGGGKLATQLAEKLNIPQQVVDGRRITDAETLKIVTMVYAGYINKNIVSDLQGFNCNAFGLSGADGNLIQAHKRHVSALDYGYAGDIDKINIGLLDALLQKNLVPVIAPVTHDAKGQLLNTNADTIASGIAKALAKTYEAVLIFSFEKKGVLKNFDDETSVISTINKKNYKDLKQNKIISAGMLPKIDNAFAALEAGVKKIIIGKAEELSDLINGNSGTSIANG